MGANGVREVTTTFGRIARGGAFNRSITLTDAGRDYLHAPTDCDLCGARHRKPREIAIVGCYLIVCYGAAYARNRLGGVGR